MAPSSPNDGVPIKPRAIHSLYTYPFPFERNPVKEKTDSYGTWPYSTVGKLFYNDPQTNTDHVCTGVVVAAANLDVVMTAAHCLRSGGTNDHMYADFLFVPAYDNGLFVLGEWAWRGTTVPGQWAQSADPSYDYGALIMDVDTSGRHIQSVTGGLGIQYNQPRKTHWHIEGYPDTPPFDGGAMVECTSSYASDGVGTTLGTGCDAPSDGSPWITQFETEGANGDYLNGLTTYQYSSPNEPDAVYGPYFDNGVLVLANRAAGR